MAVQMTRAEYEAKYGAPPASKPGPVKMTRAEYEAKYAAPKQDGFFKSVAKDVLKPIARLGVNAYQSAQIATGRTTAASVNVPFVGKTKPVGVSGNFGRDVLDSIGVGIEAASTLLPVGKAPALLKAGVKGAVVQGAKTGAKVGATSGTGYGAGRELQNPDATLASVATKAALGGATGTVGGAGLGGVLAVPGAAANKLRSHTTVDGIVNRRLQELQKLEDNNAVVRRVTTKHKDRGIDSKKILAQTDLLQNAVDDTGTLRTQNAIRELNDFIKPQEDVISANLKVEGVKIPLEMVRRELTKAITDSGIMGGARLRALKAVDDDIAGYALQADKDGYIDLALVHAAKVDKYANINYLNPESKRADKLIAKTLKQLVESRTKSVDVNTLNKELSQHYSVLDLLEKLDGRKVEGGKLGKYFAQTVGSIVGSHFGPLGSIIGAELGGRIKGATMASKLSGKTGLKLKPSEAMTSAIAKGKANQTPIPLGPRDYSNSLGSRNSTQTTTIAPTTNAIPTSLPRKPTTPPPAQKSLPSSDTTTKPTLFKKAKRIVDGIKKNGNRGFAKVPFVKKIPEPEKIAKNMDARDIKTVRQYLDLADGKIKRGGEEDVRLTGKVDELLGSMDIKPESFTSEKAKVQFLAALRDHFATQRGGLGSILLKAKQPRDAQGRFE